MSAFVPHTALIPSSFTHSSPPSTTSRLNRPVSTPRMSLYPYSPTVDEYFAKSVTAQYIAKACPTGVPPLQCIEGTTRAEPYDLRTLKRQSQLRYRQLPTALKLRAMYETRKEAIIGTHGCSHEEGRVISNPMLAKAMTLGQAESVRACSRYIQPKDKAEEGMVRSVENIYMKAVNGSGVFSTACTDGQARYEAYLAAVRGGSIKFRMGQYSTFQKIAASYAAKKRAIAREHICLYEDGLYARFPAMAGAMRPEFGYYMPFVTSPSDRKVVNTPGVGIDPGRAAALDALARMSLAKAE